ncbi:MAG TPA: hypothetical protein PLB62_00585 [Candidatus Sumerlaeota bacterium]|nr:hypothetical protein [Candidatus Sumerlaeota bacterium]
MIRTRHNTRGSAQRKRAFTFAEILAAMLFMAIVIPATVRGVSLANRMGVMAERKRIAAELADRKLTEVIIDQSWRDGEQDGIFDETDRENVITCRWALETEAWGDGTMRLVIVRVFFIVQGTEHSVALATLAPEEEETAEES